MNITNQRDPRMGDAYDPSKPTKTLMYLDANSLYPTAMREFLPLDQYVQEHHNVQQSSQNGDVQRVRESDAQ